MYYANIKVHCTFILAYIVKYVNNVTLEEDKNHFAYVFYRILLSVFGMDYFTRNKARPLFAGNPYLKLEDGKLIIGLIFIKYFSCHTHTHAEAAGKPDSTGYPVAFCSLLH